MGQSAESYDEKWLRGVARERLHRHALAKAEAKAAAAVQQAKEARQTQAAFLSGLNHELRTPLNAITGFAGLLREIPEEAISPEKRAEYLDHILQSAGILLERIDAIIDAARPASAKRGDEGPGDILMVLRQLIQDHSASLFVAKVDVNDSLPKAELGPKDLHRLLKSVFALLSPADGQRQAIGLAARSSGQQGSCQLVFTLLTPAGHVTEGMVRSVREQLGAFGIGLTLETGQGGERLLVSLPTHSQGGSL
jgi:nitrogen-specific signal transduction histidine kinase